MVLIFGIDREPPGLTRNKSVNPCLRVYGLGPDGKTCKTCKHLVAKRYANTYYKCALRKNTGGAGTDHRVNWTACGKWEAE